MVGANIDSVAEGMGLDSRIGGQFLRSGIGYGGSCFPKDTKALHWLAKFNDYELKTVKAAIEVNENQKIKLIKKARKYYKSGRTYCRGIGPFFQAWNGRPEGGPIPAKYSHTYR
jgi:UDPglucose 6-dehydrogenase